jgi:hypothetical protein
VSATGGTTRGAGTLERGGGGWWQRRARRRRRAARRRTVAAGTVGGAGRGHGQSSLGMRFFSRIHSIWAGKRG